MGSLINWLVAAAIIASPWRKRLWPLAALSVLMDPPPYVAVSDVPEAMELIQRYYRYYLEKGYPRGLVEKAMEWAKELAEAMTNKLDLPYEEKKRVLVSMLKFYLEKAEEWMRGILGLVGAVAPTTTKETTIPTATAPATAVATA